MTHSEPDSEPDHYQILNLPPPTSTSKPPSAQDIKAAYHHALLSHHPDKTSAAKHDAAPSIDTIKKAYTTLSNPSLRREYDRILLLQSTKSKTRSQQRSGYTGSETLDLDDLDYTEGSGWFLACRCGEKRGYVVRESDLEKEELAGGREIVVGCVGCSLWIRVGFDVVEGDQEVDRLPVD